MRFRPKVALIALMHSSSASCAGLFTHLLHLLQLSYNCACAKHVQFSLRLFDWEQRQSFLLASKMCYFSASSIWWALVVPSASQSGFGSITAFGSCTYIRFVCPPSKRQRIEFPSFLTQTEQISSCCNFCVIFSYYVAIIHSMRNMSVDRAHFGEVKEDSLLKLHVYHLKPDVWSIGLLMRPP